MVGADLRLNTEDVSGLVLCYYTSWLRHATSDLASIYGCSSNLGWFDINKSFMEHTFKVYHTWCSSALFKYWLQFYIKSTLFP